MNSGSDKGQKNSGIMLLDKIINKIKLCNLLIFGDFIYLLMRALCLFKG